MEEGAVVRKKVERELFDQCLDQLMDKKTISIYPPELISILKHFNHLTEECSVHAVSEDRKCRMDISFDYKYNVTIKIQNLQYGMRKMKRFRYSLKCHKPLKKCPKEYMEFFHDIDTFISLGELSIEELGLSIQGTTTGRMSASAPNYFHNSPKTDSIYLNFEK